MTGDDDAGETGHDAYDDASEPGESIRCTVTVIPEGISADVRLRQDIADLVVAEAFHRRDVGSHGRRQEPVERVVSEALRQVSGGAGTRRQIADEVVVYKENVRSEIPYFALPTRATPALRSAI